MKKYEHGSNITLSIQTLSPYVAQNSAVIKQKSCFLLSLCTCFPHKSELDMHVRACMRACVYGLNTEEKYLKNMKNTSNEQKTGDEFRILFFPGSVIFVILP